MPTYALILFVLVSLCPERLASNHSARLIVWNVGQGQFVTLSDSQYCWHFDMGGEFLPKEELFSECGQKKNYVSFTHWDWDHIGLARKAQRHLRSLCLVHFPGGKGQPQKKRFLSFLPLCSAPDRSVRSLQLTQQQLNRWKQRKKSLSLSNLSSRAFLVQNRILIAGDGPKEAEWTWAIYLKAPSLIEGLVLGHHGSRTSTSPYLLRRLRNLKLSIASARKRRYGHPHSKTKKRLRSRGVPILTTEDWGHLSLPLPKKSPPYKR